MELQKCWFLVRCERPLVAIGFCGLVEQSLIDGMPLRRATPLKIHQGSALCHQTKNGAERTSFSILWHIHNSLATSSLFLATPFLQLQ
jgi:hypothetical protein